MSRKYKFHNKQGLYFATINWIDVFTRQVYFDVLADSVRYCRKDLRLRKESTAFAI
jgi:putative transposase